MKVAQIILQNLIVVAIVLFSKASAEPFPLDEFKAFVNSKPTVEDFQFRVRTTKSQVSIISKDTYRLFHLKYQNRVCFSLDEDATGYTKPAVRFFSGRFEDSYWHSYNVGEKFSDVITTVSPDSETPTLFTEGPAGVALAELGLAQDALNMGISSVGEIGVNWDGLSFSCRSNLAGSRVEGRLLLNAKGEPDRIQFALTLQGKSYGYQVRYAFNPTGGLPSFFPSKITWESVHGGQPVVISDYEITKLILSQRQLTFPDVDWMKWLTTNSTHFIYTNGSSYAVRNYDKRGPRLIPVKTGTVTPGVSSLTVRLWLILFSIASAALLIFVYMTVNRKKT